jgi:hypothetical protein
MEGWSRSRVHATLPLLTMSRPRRLIHCPSGTTIKPVTSRTYKQEHSPCAHVAPSPVRVDGASRWRNGGNAGGETRNGMNKLKKLMSKAAVSAVAASMLAATLVMAQSTGSGSGNCSGSAAPTGAIALAAPVVNCPAGTAPCVNGSKWCCYTVPGGTCKTGWRLVVVVVRGIPLVYCSNYANCT